MNSVLKARMALIFGNIVMMIGLYFYSRGIIAEFSIEQQIVDVMYLIAVIAWVFGSAACLVMIKAHEIDGKNGISYILFLYGFLSPAFAVITWLDVRYWTKRKHKNEGE